MRYIISLLILIISLAGCISQSETSLETTTPDFSATATAIISEATQTAVSYINQDCENVSITRWTVNLYVDDEGIIDPEQSNGQNQPYISAWSCNGNIEDVEDYFEYLIFLNIETDAIEFTNVLAEVILALDDYPADNTPPIEPIILIALIQPVSEQIPKAHFEINYNVALDAIESGLVGQALYDAVVTISDR